jgi:TrmH family RNA methyltransferase
MSVLRSRDNARVRRWHALGHDARTRRTEHSALLEGAHLLAACLDAGSKPRAVIVSESGLRNPEIAALAQRAGLTPVTLADGLFRWIADTVTPAGLAAEIAIAPARATLPEAQHAVFLDGVQDAGNVGALLRSAAAFGADVAVLGPGCADAWSPKVLRAAMGAHFSLRIAEMPDLAQALAQFGGPLVCTAPTGGTTPAATDLTGRLGWIFGAEGQGVSAAAAALATHRISIPLAPGAESLNVAASAAILFYERARQLSTSGARS